ncbi:C40 family peptidase [Arthrobacter antioxidans]|uniref:C40 family peptidase n=1 Tax=Arthrobacter antioxidans TaxID=2895818 RepID=UPI001FFEBE9F|nr:C40 family peptidase [Arthrobacter antioxidans]
MTITDAVGRIQQIQSTLTMLSTPAARAQAAPATTGASSAGSSKAAPGSSADLFADALAGVSGASGGAAGAGSADAAPAVAPVAGSSAPAPVAGAGTAPVPVPASADAARLIEAARSYEGVPYVWGGTDPASGLDCSGFVQRAYADIGIQIPRVTWDQMNAGTQVPSLAEAQPGDLLFSLEGGHVSMYLGGGKAIDAPQPGKTVAVRDMWETDANITTIRRILPADPAGTASVAAPAVAAAAVPESAEPAYAAQAAFLASMAR